MCEFEQSDPELVKRFLAEHVEEYDLVEQITEGIADPFSKENVEPKISEEDIIDQW